MCGEEEVGRETESRSGPNDKEKHFKKQRTMERNTPLLATDDVKCYTTNLPVFYSVYIDKLRNVI